MKDQYFGDINDYRKYGLLRALAIETGLPLGVCWLLTPNDDRPHGEFRTYLQEPRRWRHFDPELYDRLQGLLRPDTTRSVRLAREWGLLPNATYYEGLLTDPNQARHSYFTQAWRHLETCPLLFFDPDNGIEVRSKRIGTKDSAKYVYWTELEHAYARWHSLVIYQHFGRQSRDAYVQRLAADLASRLQAPLVDSFRTAHVVFFLVAQPAHVPTFSKAHARIHEGWKGQITASAHVAG